MNDVRATTLFAKKEEIANVVVSRKRKLRELYAVARYTEPIPSVPLNYDVGNELPYDTAEGAFLEANDILRGLYFDESTLPTRPARSSTLDAKSGTLAANSFPQPFTKPSPAGPSTDRNGTLYEVPAGVREQSRKVSPDKVSASEFGCGWKEDGIATTKFVEDTTKEPPKPDTSRLLRPNPEIPTTPRDASLSENSVQVDLSRDELDESLSWQQRSEKERIKSKIESPDGSPGVDPARAMAISSEEVATLSGPPVTLSRLDGHHSARTLHLPGREMQERHTRATGEAQDQRDKGDEGGQPQPSEPTRSAEPESSPSSTVGAYSANTPGMNAASPDTSPDDGLPLDTTSALRSKVPPSLVPSEGARLAKAEHDSLLKSQMEIAHSDAFAQTPSNPDTQLRLEEQEAARGGAMSGNQVGGIMGFSNSVPSADQVAEAVERSPLTKRASELVQDIMEDAEDEVVGVPTPEDKDGFQDPEKNPPTNTLGLDSSASNNQGPAASSATEGQFSIGNPQGGQSSKQHDRVNGIQALSPIRTDMSALTKDDRAAEVSNDRYFTGLVESPGALETTGRSQSDLDGDVAMPDSTIVDSATPTKSAPTPTSVQSPPERMTTRVSSGALRHKSVSEILGETPKPLHTQTPKPIPDKISTPVTRLDSASRPPTPASENIEPYSPLTTLRTGERREKERSKLSTVIFAKQQRQSKAGSSPLWQRRTSSGEQVMEDDRDYFYPLFAQTASHPRSPPLNKLLETARKTITTADLYVNVHEQQDCRILRRIYQLQYANRWSLRQMERAVEPSRPNSHWDLLLDEMKWMRTDFREERKWKLAAAKNLADWCARWVANNSEGRRSLQVKIKATYQASRASPAPREEGINRQLIHSDGMVQGYPTPAEAITDIAPVGNNGISIDRYEGLAPAGVFSLGCAEITFNMKKTPSSDRLLAELPIYEPFGRKPDTDLPKSESSPDSNWKTAILPITKYAVAKIISKEVGPPRKRSRFHYDNEDDEMALNPKSDSEKIRAEVDIATKTLPLALPSEQDDVALFNPDNKHIRDRIHASHAFRPPSEFNMPSQSFFENRTSSQWTWSEDVQLRELVREYSYNWSLISSIMSPRSIFSSGAERRTPWECFERWIGLEGLPGDMQKTQYFRAYHSRLDAAQRSVAAQQQALSQGNNNGPPLTPLRRRTTLPIKVDRRRSNKHLALIDAMRKLAKKRETTLSKQQHSAAMSASRKANEAPQARNPMQTPQEFSRMKHDREQKMQKAAELYRQNVLQQQRAAMQQQRSNQQANQQHSIPNGTGQQPRNGTPGMANGASPAMSSSISKANNQPGHPNQARPHSSLQPLQNGSTNQQVVPIPSGVNPTVQIGMKGVPQAQMQSSAQGQQRPPPQMGPDNMRVIMEATRVQQEQQRFLNQQRHQQQLPQFSNQSSHHNQTGPSSSPNMGHANGNSPHNPALLAAMHAAANLNGNGMPTTNGINTTGGSSSSPQMSQSHPNQPQHLSSGHIPAVTNISHQLKARNPQMSSDQITKLTNEHLAAQYRNSMTQAAINAAAGGSGSNNNPNANNAMNQHAHQQNQQQAGIPNGSNTGQLNYAQMMRVQQSNQSRANTSGVRPPSRSATPQNGPRSGGGSQAGQSTQNQSPRPPQAQMAGGQ
ncbi:MAG: chromatin modification- protein VID21 [Candelina mexicana]|nr:MAG: chromatin modification- protein VID21 [Candelina mexicana]